MSTIILSRETTTTRGHVSRRVRQQAVVSGDSEHVEQLMNEFMQIVGSDVCRATQKSDQQGVLPGKGPYGISLFSGICDFILVVLRLLEAAPFILGTLVAAAA